MAKFFIELNAYGADINGALERFLGDEELYADCLNQFAEDLNFAALKQAIDGKDYESAFNYAHSLKGVAGNLGLVPLYNAISELVDMLRADEYKNLDKKHDDIIRLRHDFAALLH